MGLLNFLTGGAADAVKTVVDSLGTAVDSVFTSDEERAQARAVLLKLEQAPQLAQIELNKIEAASMDRFKSGWRPMIGWVCAISLGIYYIPQFLLADYLWVRTCLLTQSLAPYPASAAELMELVVALLGLGLYRTVEKLTSKA